MSKNSDRRRDFATILYPDSAPSNFLEIIEAWHISCFLSPLHDRDHDANGEVKKPHYHLMVMYSAPHSLNQVKALFSQVNGVGILEVYDKRDYARYLCHLDSYNKAQYSPQDVRSFGSVDYNSVIDLPSSKYSTIYDMTKFIRKNKCYSFADLLDYSAENCPEWFRSLCDRSTLVITQYMKTLAWEERKNDEGKS